MKIARTKVQELSPIPEAQWCHKKNWVGCSAGRLIGLVTAMFFMASMISSGQEQPGRPLRDAIDSYFQTDQPKPLSSSDGEFARRVSIDLTGMPLGVDRLREFLQNQQPDKREQLVSELIATPLFERRLATFLDNVLMERRKYQDVSEADWEGFLLESVQQNKPWNILAREILSADGIDGKLRPAVRFYLARGGEPNLLTRDIGRVFFGKDLQCAQCHDHPLVDDYLQSDYQGLLAFVAPGFIKTVQKPGPKTKDGKPGKPVSVKIFAEKDGNDINFESVFVKETKHRTGPRLIGEKSILEPDRLPLSTTSADRPENSRRDLLSVEATDGTNSSFNENIANRLWGMMMGRGLVDPPDFHHRDNAPVKPKLMKELGLKMVEMNFDLRAFVREIALSKVYQRAYAIPAWSDSISEIESQLATQKNLKAELEKRISAAVDEYDQADQDWSGSEARYIPVALNVEKSRQAYAKASTDAAKLKTAWQAAQAASLQQKELAGLMAQAEKDLGGVQSRIPDKDVVELNQLLAGKLKKLAAAASAAEKKTVDAKGKWDAKNRETDQAKISVEQQIAQKKPLRMELDQRESRQRNMRTRLEALVMERSAVDSEIATLEKLIDHHKLKHALDKLSGQPGDEQQKLAGDVGRLEETLAIRLSKNHVISSLRPLTPEQLCWSTLQVTGVYDRTRLGEEVQFRQKAKIGAEQPLNPTQQRAVESLTHAKMKSHVNNFIRYYAAGAGQPQGDFFATADQALFAANSGSINSYINPAAGNVTERMLKMEDHQKAAEELYLSILSRYPTKDEIQEIGHYLTLKKENKRQAVMELAWALINSVEFRFNH